MTFITFIADVVVMNPVWLLVSLYIGILEIFDKLLKSSVLNPAEMVKRRPMNVTVFEYQVPVSIISIGDFFFLLPWHRNS